MMNAEASCDTMDTGGKKRFPILGLDARSIEKHPDRPRDVSWSLLAPHEAQAVKNHDQSLERLARRGGLSVTEMVAVIEGRSLSWIREQGRGSDDSHEMWARLIEHIRTHEGIAATEMEWLRWFYQNADFGPADGDVREHLKERFKSETRKELPRGYGEE